MYTKQVYTKFKKRKPFYLMQDQAQASQTVSLPGRHAGVNGGKTKRKGAAVAAFP